jgi:uncharacterized protein (DUF4415 family)
VNNARDGGSQVSARIKASDTSENLELGPAFFANAIALPGLLRDVDIRASLGIGAPKKMISIRVDGDVLDYFRKRGKGYQRRMNFALRAFMWREQQAEAAERAAKRQPRATGKKTSRRSASGTLG